MLKPTSILKLLGLIGGIPLSVAIGSKQVMVLYLLLFIPLSLSIILLRPVTNTKWTLIDKTTGAYFLWALLGFGIFVLQAVLSDSNDTGARAVSALGTAVYAVLPFLLGRFLCQSDEEIQCIFEGLVAGVVLSCGTLLASYAIQWPIDIFLARYEIGQRIPMVVGFVAALSLSRNQPLPKLFVIIFITISLVALSETRVSIAAFMISLLLILLAFGKIYGKNKVLTIMIAILLVGALASQITASLRYRVVLLTSTVDSWMHKEQPNEVKPNEVKPNEVKPNEEHLVDASADMRLQIWKNLFSKVTDGPIHFILGYGQLGPSYVGDPLRYESGYVVQMYSAHNEYLDVFVRSGMVGVILYLALYCSVIVSAWKNRGGAPGSIGFMFYHMVFALLGVALYGMFHETTRYPWFGVLFWLFAGILSSRSANGLSAVQSKGNTN